MQVDSFTLRTIYNSRVQPTVEAVMNGRRTAAPSGASTGTHEALCFMPDNLDEIEADITDAVVGEDLDQSEFDQLLREIDGTDNFAEIGAAAIASSFAFAKASGIDTGGQFPSPVGNLVGGGAHGGNTTIQEFLVVPEADTIPGAMQQLSRIYNAFKEQYSRRITGINDEGAFVTRMDDQETLIAVTGIAEEYGARVGIDVAASEFYRGEEDRYHYEELGESFAPDEQLSFMRRLVDRFGLAYVEDPFHEEDYERFAQFTDAVDALVVGDDIFVTRRDRLQHGVDIGAGNSIIIKPNQVGTITTTRETVELAQDQNMVPVISHRSGDTCDPVIADLALAWNIPLIKAGIAGIRTVKNNQLLRRWDENPGEIHTLF